MDHTEALTTGTTITQLYDLIQIVNPSQPILLVGDTGIGKTSIVRHVAEKVMHKRMSYIPCMEATDMIDITGMMDTSGDRTCYKPPSWYHEGEDVVVLMDEVNRNKAVLKGLMRLASDRKVGDAQLTDNSYVIAAINPEHGAVYQVYEMDPAMLARFLVVYLKPTVDEWLEYAEETGVHPAVREYISGHRDDLYTFDNEDNVAKSKVPAYQNVLPCPRAWCGLSDFMLRAEKFVRDGNALNRFSREEFPDGESFLYSVVRGFVGNAVADRFVPGYYSSRGGIPSPAELMNGNDAAWKSRYPKAIARLCADDACAANELGTAVCRYIAANESKLWDSTHTRPSLLAAKFAKNLFRFLYSCNPEIQSSVFHADIETVDLVKVKWPKLLGVAFPGLTDYLESKFCTPAVRNAKKEK